MADDGNGKIQVEINRNNITWLINQAKEIKTDLNQINARLLGILIAMVTCAFGFIGTLLITFLNTG